MGHITPQQIAIVLVIVILILGKRYSRGLGLHTEDIERISAELQQRMPVYSAETTRGKEAEFIRDRLPKRFPFALLLLAAVVLGATVWWLSR